MYSTVCKIDTELVIPASPAQVWAVFGDFAKWGEWNDFMVLPIVPKKILVLSPNKELRWKDYRGLLYSQFFQGSHWYILEELPNGHTRFVHGAVMMGLAIPFLWATMQATERGYNYFNQALCREVVARSKRRPGKQRIERVQAGAHSG
eukprot:gene6030-6268_t